MSRMYYGYPEAEVFFLEGCQLFDWEPFYQLAQDQEQQRRQQQPRFKQQYAGDRKAVALNKAIETFMRKNFVTGARNVTLFRLARWLSDEGVDDPVRMIIEQNMRSGCPLPDEEVKKIIKKL